ncbi:MAG TPA: MazG nucleotide pyrophosphohydrolase domain-containing protein [Bacillota bacterium]|nr:MazG nucleotide pyrophosphohydrolase domain-containing protein [Bacillota bacterium]
MQTPKSKQGIETLLSIMKLLRSPDGCPWDRQQTMESLLPHVLEEAYELADAVLSGDGNKICEELGDLLLQVVFISQLAEEKGLFTFGDAVTCITEKLIRRHPHIFGAAHADDPGQVNELWAQVKAREAGEAAAAKVPPLPGLLLLEKMAQKADADCIEDPLVRQLLRLVQEARKDNRSIEGEIRRCYAKIGISGRNFNADGE